MLTYTGLEIMFPKFPIMVISSHESHDFPAFSVGFSGWKPCFSADISDFLPIGDRLLFQALL
jgi:hypothetical protein